MFVLKDALQVPWDALGKDRGILFNVFHMGQLYCLTKKKKSDGMKKTDNNWRIILIPVQVFILFTSQYCSNILKYKICTEIWNTKLRALLCKSVCKLPCEEHRCSFSPKTHGRLLNKSAVFRSGIRVSRLLRGACARCAPPGSRAFRSASPLYTDPACAMHPVRKKDFDNLLIPNVPHVLQYIYFRRSWLMATEVVRTTCECFYTANKTMWEVFWQLYKR